MEQPTDDLGGTEPPASDPTFDGEQELDTAQLDNNLPEDTDDEPLPIDPTPVDPELASNKATGPTGEELSELPAGLLGEDESQGESADAADGKNDLPRQLAAFEQLLNYQVTPVLPDTEVLPSAPPLTAEEMGLTSDQSASLPAIDLAQMSQTELPPWIVRDRSLSTVVNLWNHLSGIPTIVNLDAMAAAGIDRNQLISLQQVKPQSAQAMGAALAAAAGCSLIPRDNAFWSIQPTLDQIRQVVPTQISLEGLVSAADQEWFSTTVTDLLPELDGQVRRQDNQLQFTAADEADPQLWFAWFRLVRLIANWQQLVTGKMSLESSSLNEQTLLQPWVDAASVVALDKSLSFVTIEAVPSGQLLSRCAEEAGLECWIDWANVGATGLQPSSRLSVVTRNRSFRRVLADYASQYSLVVSLLDERNIWLTSPLRYRSEARLYVVPAGGRTAEQWQQQLRLLTPIDANGNSLLRIIPSPDQKWMLLRCCPPALRF